MSTAMPSAMDVRIIFRMDVDTMSSVDVKIIFCMDVDTMSSMDVRIIFCMDVDIVPLERINHILYGCGHNALNYIYIYIMNVDIVL